MVQKVNYYHAIHKIVLKPVYKLGVFVDFECWRHIWIPAVTIKCSVHNLICDIVNHCACSCDVGKMPVYDKIWIKNPKKEKTFWRIAQAVNCYGLLRWTGAIYSSAAAARVVVEPGSLIAACPSYTTCPVFTRSHSSPVSAEQGSSVPDGLLHAYIWRLKPPTP